MRINNPKSFLGFSYSHQSEEGSSVTQKELTILDNSLRGYINGLLFGCDMLPTNKNYGFAWLEQNGRIPEELIPPSTVTNSHLIDSVLKLGFKYDAENKVLEISHWDDAISIEAQVNDALRIYFLKQFFDLVPITEGDVTTYMFVMKPDFNNAERWSRGDIVIIKNYDPAAAQSGLNDARVIGAWLITNEPENFEDLIASNNTTFSDWCAAANEFSFMNISNCGQNESDNVIASLVGNRDSAYSYDVTSGTLVSLIKGLINVTMNNEAILSGLRDGINAELAKMNDDIVKINDKLANTNTFVGVRMNGFEKVDGSWVDDGGSGNGDGSYLSGSAIYAAKIELDSSKSKVISVLTGDNETIECSVKYDIPTDASAYASAIISIRTAVPYVDNGNTITEVNPFDNISVVAVVANPTKAANINAVSGATYTLGQGDFIDSF